MCIFIYLYHMYIHIVVVHFSLIIIHHSRLRIATHSFFGLPRHPSICDGIRIILACRYRRFEEVMQQEFLRKVHNRRPHDFAAAILHRQPLDWFLKVLHYTEARVLGPYQMLRFVSWPYEVSHETYIKRLCTIKLWELFFWLHNQVCPA